MEKTVNNQGFYALYYKSGKLSPEEKKRMNDIAYQKSMESLKKNPKGYALSLIAVAYEEVYNYSLCKTFDYNELFHQIHQKRMRIKEICSIYRLGFEEVKEYFERNKFIFRMERRDFCLPCEPLASSRIF